MANKTTNKKNTPKKTTTKGNYNTNRFTTGGAMVPVDLSKVEWANKPKK